MVVPGDLAFGGPGPAECVTLIRHRGYPLTTLRENAGLGVWKRNRQQTKRP